VSELDSSSNTLNEPLVLTEAVLNRMRHENQSIALLVQAIEKAGEMSVGLDEADGEFANAAEEL
jgi:hypothetical protein